MKRDLGKPSRLEALHMIERQYDLFGYRIDGWSAWRVLRNPLSRQAEALPLAQPARANGLRAFRALWGSISLLCQLIRGRRRELLVKTCRSGLRLPEGERFRDVYFDGLLATGYSYIKLEEINSPNFEQQAAVARFPATLNPVVFTFWGMVLARLLPMRSANVYCRRVSMLLAEEVGLVVPSRWLLMRVSTAYWQARIYGLLLRRLQPKAVLVSDTGEYGLSIACRRHGVRFIELQHGVFDAEHPDAIPDWVNGSPTELLLPDTLACRGNYWIEQLRGTRQGRDHACPVGNELIDLARERRTRRGVRSGLRLVLSSQGLDSERLAGWIQEFVVAAPVDVVWRLTIKLHPVYDADNRSFDSLNDPRISVISGAELPNIFDLLADADLHLSIASACHFDAAALGVPSVVIPLAGHEAMLTAIDGRLIHLAQRPSDPWKVHGDATLGADANHYSEPGFIFNLAGLLASAPSITDK